MLRWGSGAATGDCEGRDAKIGRRRQEHTAHYARCDCGSLAIAPSPAYARASTGRAGAGGIKPE
eukprot:6653671-Alexandrium_andersonii.AAC.1